MQENTEKLTPMFAQYRSIKKNYPDALLFFRMGDFYELFFEDAIIASRELQLALTSRGKNGANAAPMCGMPWHTYQSYVAQLIDRGYNVAICEQTEDPAKAKGLVARAVTAVITPATFLDESALAAKSHNFLGAVFCGMHDNCAFAFADVSTGAWSGVEFRRQADLWQWVAKISPRELLLVDGQQLPSGMTVEGMRVVHQPAVNFELKRASERLLEAQGVREAGALGLEGKSSLVRACGAILAYLDQTGARKPGQFLPFRPLDLGKRLLIDELTERNLEIFRKFDGRKGKGTLLYVLDQTITPMGGRLLEDMLRHPWRDLRQIRKIQEKVQWFFTHDNLRSSFRNLLKGLSDLERLIVRISLGRFSRRDFFSLRDSLNLLPQLLELLTSQDVPESLEQLIADMDILDDVRELLQKALADDPASENLFHSGFNSLYDRQIELLADGSAKLEQMLDAEKEKTGLSKLKMGYNRVFGHYFEITRNALAEQAPEHFLRKQSLANCERFTTSGLQQLEAEIANAAEQREQLEAEMLDNLRSHIASMQERILLAADFVAHLDYWQGLAEVARREDWAMPTLNEGQEIAIRAGRHPVVESIIGKNSFVANDFYMDSTKRFCLLTGPNMAGKSTILRQVALICLLAQIGSMVPAESASIGIVDRLFSRVGASDNLARGQSTFMVEMIETARILRQASRRSLVILDEIGRGTSTYDGMAIAWAVAEDLAQRCQGQVRTLFATHYHELTSLEGQLEGLFTMNVSAGSHDHNEIIFLHRLLPGPSDKSYGVEVARLAGIPYPVVQRARDLLKSLEEKKAGMKAQVIKLPGFDDKADNVEKGRKMVLMLSGLDLDSLNPENALQILREWREEIEK